jgi:amidase
VTDYTYSTAAELTAAMESGAVSAVELAAAAIARIERLDGDINAICVRDFDRALDAARAADAARARGEKRPLLGVPMTVKESFNVAGLSTTWGVRAFKDFVPDTDALAVTRLKTAGAVILGKTNVSVGLGDFQSYNPIYGSTNNPWDLTRTPGGSSGGSSAALAAGFGALSIGSDIGGSLRIPAHFTGVYAHKSSAGLLPLRGHTFPGLAPLAYDRDLGVIGPMARSAGDLALLMGLLSDPDETGAGIAFRTALRPPRHEELASFRVLVLDGHPLVPVAAEIRAAIDDLATRLEAAGVNIQRHTPLLPDQAEVARTYMRLLQASVAASYPPEVYESAAAGAARLDPEDVSLAAERIRGIVLSYRDWISADTIRTRHRAQWAELFTEFDIVISPVFSTPAFPHDESPLDWAREISIDGSPHDYFDQLVWAANATASGLPSTAVPVARSADGLPIGVQLIGPLLEDYTPIRFAELIGDFVPPPL